MSHNQTRNLHVNPSARLWRYASPIDCRVVDFHRRFPGFSVTPLVSLDSVAAELGVRHVFIKDESTRMNLPSFKILGASWATYRAILLEVNLAVGVSLEELSVAARKEKIKLFAATDGNHGRAVARMAKLLGIKADIFISIDLDQITHDIIASEGARVIVHQGDYDSAVRQAKIQAETAGGILIQDTALKGYEEIPQVRCSHGSANGC